jgi:dephospho-CoA kinase
VQLLIRNNSLVFKSQIPVVTNDRDLGLFFLTKTFCMIKVGLTGGIGSGKSTVAKVFESLGIPVYYADDATKRLMNTNDTIKTAIISQFGEATYKNGELDRKYLASIVFDDTEKLALLNSITHPVTIRDAELWMKKQNSPYIIKEAALLFESGAAEHLDYIIGVSAPENLRIERVMKRDTVSKDEVLKRITRQMEEVEKMKRCDFIITNNEQQLVIPQVISLHEKLLDIAAR